MRKGKVIKSLPEHLRQWYSVVSDSVVSSKLKEGDLVLQSDLVWRLRNRRTYASWKTGHSDIVLFSTDVIGYWHSKDSSNFPEHWIDGWAIQGNDLRKWTVVEDNSYREEEE